MSLVPEDESRVTTGEPPASADRRKNAGSASELPDESEVTFLDDSEEVGKSDEDDADRSGGTR